MREIIILLAVLVLGIIAVTVYNAMNEPEQSVTIIMVRHAERGDGDNPDLTLAGRQRAEALAELMRDVDLAAVYSTPFNRTEQTARPTADQKELSIENYMFGALAEIEPFMSSAYDVQVCSKDNLDDRAFGSDTHNSRRAPGRGS